MCKYINTSINIININSITGTDIVMASVSAVKIESLNKDNFDTRKIQREAH